jgi:heterodisulfide reductase subunit A-like polyferredoxin
MPVVITGNMTPEEVDQAMINDLNERVAASGGGTIQVSHEQIVRVLELLGAKGKPKEIKSQVEAAEAAAAPAAQTVAAAPRKTRAELNEMTKEELLEVAEDEDVEVAASWTKADIIDAIIKRKK